MHTKLNNDIYFVGYIDWDLRDFHSFQTKRGVTYNSHLIIDEKIALIDSIKKDQIENLKINILEITTFEKIDYIIVNHAEPDHGGGLSEIVSLAKNAKIVCNEKCKQILAGYHDIKNWNFLIVKDFDKLSLGKRTLQFILTPMVHWPDSMFTYIIEDEFLFSMDAFGQHFCTSSRFDSDVDKCDLFDEAKKYYANIVYPFGNQVLRVLDKIKDMPIKRIIPSHGVIWEKYLTEILQEYNFWASYQSKEKVLILYDTMWNSTKKMAEAILSGVEKKNVEVKLIYLRNTSLTEIAKEILEARCIAFGTSTLNMQMMPQMGALITYLKGLKPKNKKVFAFGSFGWGKSAAEELENILTTDLRFKCISSFLACKWQPDNTFLEKCKEIGKELARSAKEN